MEEKIIPFPLARRKAEIARSVPTPENEWQELTLSVPAAEAGPATFVY